MWIALQMPKIVGLSRVCENPQDVFVICMNAFPWKRVHNFSSAYIRSTWGVYVTGKSGKVTFTSSEVSEFKNML